MIFKIRHGLLECTNYPANKKSAIIFNDEFIITSAYLLYPYLRKYNSSSKNANHESIVELLKSRKVDNSQSDLFETFDLEITYDQHKIQSKSRNLLRFRAKILFIFKCPEILSSTQTILNVLSEYSGSDEISVYNNNLHKLIISSFMILQLIYPDIREENTNFKYFIDQMKNYVKFVDPINKLDDVLTISTPFGMESFYKTINVGKVSNVFGSDGCLFTISNNLVNGCEGAAVINSRLRLVGIIICTTFRWNNENTNFTLAANFRHVLKEFLRQIGETFSNGSISRIPTTPDWEKGVVLIRNSSSWGTGSLVKIKNAKFILTCSHVIKDPNQTVLCHYADGMFETTTIWKNPNYNQPFDIAIIKVPMSITDAHYLQLSNTVPYVGQHVYSAGFPLASQLGKDIFRPSLYEGRIVKFMPSMIISDTSVQAGQSGGPLLDINGQLLGISVSNSKDDETQLIHPNINMSIPIVSIRRDLKLFAKTQDVQRLNNLIAGLEIQEAWALKGPRVDCKL